MNATKMLIAGEERRLKLLEYLAAKGKLKPQNNCKPYLKDCTNLQKKRPQESSKQICETKKHASNKGSHFTFASSKSTTSNAGSLPNKPNPRKIPTVPSALAKRLVNNTESRIPLPPKHSIPRVRPDQRDHAGRTLQPPSFPSTHTKKQERKDKSDVTLTVIVTKTPGEKPEICVMDETSPTMRGQQLPGLCTSTQCKTREQGVAQPKQVPVNKAVMQATKTKILHDPKTQPSAGKPVSVASSGHIRIVSRLSQPGAKSKSANERSFLIKSSRNDGSKQLLNVRKEQSEGNSQRPACNTKHSSAAPVTSSSTTVHRKISTGPVSAPKPKPHNVDHASKRISSSQNIHSLYKHVAPRKNTVPSGHNKVVWRAKDEHNKEQSVTGATKETTTTASNLTATDITNRPQTPGMTAEDRKKKLQEWLSSKGKSYKRPPMILPPKRPPTAKKQNPCNRSLWEEIEEEEELLALSMIISQTLSECLELIEKGVSEENIHAALNKVPGAKKFAKYWVCKAKLLEREGVYDVIDVYKQGVQCGAKPIDELREVVFDIMKNTNKKTKVVTFGPVPAEAEVMENQNHEKIPLTPYTNRTEEVKTPGTSVCDQGSAMKFKITSLSRKKFSASGQEWTCLTPVRRSLRIHHSASQYPEVVQERDTVVSSLEQLLDKADTDTYLYMRNEALPEEAEPNVMNFTEKDPTS